MAVPVRGAKGVVAAAHLPPQQRAQAAQAASSAPVGVVGAPVSMGSPPVPAGPGPVAWCVFTLGEGLSCTQ
jgi:hypothetical protein